ncbi:hypothetical protein U9M48_016763 [Paspalum notatum var. saurae]|uniref:C2H2-type domain-containing protein n=1 Tax=Paspalum notatum var. saurae TaxID=547442 RepID=A0AAQ3WNI3_PASNO
MCRGLFPPQFASAAKKTLKPRLGASSRSTRVRRLRFLVGAMEFWGEEVKPGTKVSCKVTEGYVIHLSQVALGEAKKGNENVVVSLKIDEKKLVLGTLSLEKHPQIMCDIIFDKDFELSHSSKTTSVFLCDEELEADEISVKNIEIKQSAANVLVGDGKKDKQDDDEETSSGDDDFSDDSDDSEMSEDESSDEDELSSGDDDLSDDSEDETDDSEEEQTPTPKKPEVVGKKRAIEAAAATPSGKKPKTEQSGQKTGDKKASKTPVDKSAKTPTADKKSKEKSPKSVSHACKSCNKTFNSESALESHQKAKKHEA